MGDDLVSIPGGVFVMGSDTHYPEEEPTRQVRIGPFRIERTPVTNQKFARFVRATGYLTLAERQPDPKIYPNAAVGQLRAGSAVFHVPDRPVDLRYPAQWWHYVPGACWHRPRGPDFGPCEPDHPVVHVAYEDAEAYAAWLGRALPSEAQWEYAARGGLDRKSYAWGDEFMPDGRRMANTWSGEFPHAGIGQAEFVGTSSVGSFPANDYGLYDMIGNVWEWTVDYYHRPGTDPGAACCAPLDPVHNDSQTRERSRSIAGIARRVLKGGSHLCAANYCRRYRPAARHAHEEDTSTSHIGFRCIAPAG